MRQRTTLLRRALPAGCLGLLAAACSSASAAPSALKPAGPAAASIASLGWFMFAVGGLVFLLVVALLLGAIFRRRGEPAPADPPPPDLADQDPEQARRGPIRWVIGGGLIMPLVVITITYALTLGTLRALANTRPGDPARGVVIDVIGRQWWWEVRYPEQGFTTANEIHIPIGQPVTIRLTSADVIHSFWVPELHGKLDLNPGRTNTLVLQADRAGEYRGECAEFCGVQHAKMALVVVAETPEDFGMWLGGQQQTPTDPTEPALIRGQQVFLGSACVYCHTVRGTNASGVLGPDLTHLASRRTLGAGTLPNTPGHLAGWLIDPQTLKPGNKMPPTNLSGPELQDLLAYLQSLK